MAIVKQTLHPEGDTGTDIYPKTSVDQIADLPTSAKSQLYAHYINLYLSDGSGNANQFICTAFLINANPTPITSITEWLNQMSSRCIASGQINVSTPVASAKVGEYTIDRFYKVSNEQINVHGAFIGDDSVIEENVEVIAGNRTINISDTPIVLGSNAG